MPAIRAGIAGRLLKSNWREGDGRLFEEMLERADTPRNADAVGLALLDIADKRADAELEHPLLALYERGPCSFCLGSAVRQLLLRNALPPSLGEECRFDANPDIREMMENGPGE